MPRHDSSPLDGVRAEELTARLAAAEQRAADLERAVLSNRRIGIATGILMKGHLLTEEHAFDQLVRASQARNVKLTSIAADVILTGDL